MKKILGFIIALICILSTSVFEASAATSAPAKVAVSNKKENVKTTKENKLTPFEVAKKTTHTTLKKKVVERPWVYSSSCGIVLSYGNFSGDFDAAVNVAIEFEMELCGWGWADALNAVYDNLYF